MPVQIIKSESAPQPIGPYSQAIEANGFIFVSGQIALHPVTGQIISRDILAQTRRVLENIEAILNAAGSSFNHVVKTTIFLKSMDDFPVVNEIYGKYFSQSLPARSTVEVSRLPKNVLIEIECVALKND